MRNDYRRRLAHIFAICLTLFLLASCARVQGKLLIMEGNFFNTRGFYTQAIASYLRALAHEEIAPYAQFALAAVYFSLEESAAALERYAAARSSLAELNRTDPELRFRIYYNSGIIFFEMGEYRQAVNAFRNALKIDGSRIEAKRNLELSLLVMDMALAAQTAYTEATGETGEDASQAHPALFEYVRQMEMGQWRSREWESYDDNWYGPDH